MHIKFTSLQSLSGHTGLSDPIESPKPDYGFFDQRLWFELLGKHVFNAENDDLGCLLGSDSLERPVIILPVRHIHHPWLPSYFSSLTCFYTPIYHCQTLQPDKACEQLAVFFKSLKQGKFHWSRTVLYAMPKASVDTLTEELAHSSIPTQKFYCFANWYLPVNFPDYDAYWATRGSRLRNTIKRKSQQFNKLAQSRIELFLTEEALPEAVKHYLEVYNDSWKHSEAYPEFLTDLMYLAAEQNALRLAIAYLGAEPVATQFWIVADNTAYIYKLAYKEAYKSMGVGSLLTAKLMQYVIDVDKVTTVDYLTGDDAYKQDWMTQRRERWGIEVFNTSTVFGFLLYRLGLIKTLIKKLTLYLQARPLVL